MNRKLILPIAILSIVIGIAFTVNKVRQQNRVYRLSIATGRKNGDYYALAETLAKAIARHDPQLQISVIETNGATENAELLDQKKVDFAMVQNDAPPKPSFRAIALLYPELFHLIVAKDSGIKNVSDIRGKRISIPVKGSGSYLSFGILLQHYGITLDDLKTVEIPAERVNEAFSKRQVDVIFRVAALGNKGVRDLLQTTGGQLVAIDQAAAMKISKPYLEETIIPKGAYRGNPIIPDTDLPNVGVQSSLLTHKDVDPEIVREITRILFEFRNDLINENPLAASISYPGEGRILIWPLHQGAQAYYDREKPNPLQQNTDMIGLFLSIGTLGASWLWDLQRRMLEKQKNRADKYNLQLLSLIEKARKSEDLEKLEKVRQQLFEIFKKVLEDLDKDTLSPESYQLFIFPCEVALATIRDRELLLMNLPRKIEEINN